MTAVNSLPQGLLINRSKRQEYPFRFDEEEGVLYCYNRKAAVVLEIPLSGAIFPAQPCIFYAAFLVVDGGTRASFEVSLGRRQYTVVSNGNTSLRDLKAKFMSCSLLSRPKRFSFGCHMGRIVWSAAAAPFKLTDGVCTKLEKLGTRVKNTPDTVFRTPKTEPSKRFVPENIATGLAAGTGLMLYGLIGGLVGLVSEPVKCVKKKGIKGVPAGLGKGVLGLVCKPVAGTIDFLTCTIRGVNNMPRSLYRGLQKIKKKKEEHKEEASPRKTLQPLQPEEEAKNCEEEQKQDLPRVLHTLTAQKTRLLRELSQIQSLSPVSPFLTIEDSDSSDCPSFRTAKNDDSVFDETQYYGKVTI